METKKDKIYIVKYSYGGYDNYTEVIVFATINKLTATKYVTRYNKILKKWKEYYAQFVNEYYQFSEEFVSKKYDRWLYLRKLNGCFYGEVEIR